MDVRMAVWFKGDGNREGGYILGYMGHAALVQREGINEQFWIPQYMIMAVFA